MTRFTAVFIICCCIPFSADSLEYTVRPGDTLYSLSVEYDVPLTRIMRVNSLNGEDIRTGDVLQIPKDEISLVRVQPGDTLSDLALELDISSKEIKNLNSLENDELQIGQILKIPPPVPEGSYRVLPGDTVLGIALRFGLSTSELRTINGLSDNMIHPGRLLTVRPPQSVEHRVQSGETLWSIAQTHRLSVEEIQQWNSITDNSIQPGERLVLYPDISVNLASVERPQPQKPDPAAGIPRSGEYYYTFPKADFQPNRFYWESSDTSATTDYQRAQNLMKIMDSEVTERLSSDLDGWHIVIDPGHGGLDPGAIVEVRDGNGNSLVVTEDEYAYDISLRLKRALMRHGASVSMTILAPDHLIRSGVSPRQTFVHRKNEVYNSASHNTEDGWRPVGTIGGLDMRKEITSEAIRQTPASERRNGTLFVSIHADNSSEIPAGKAILFDGSNDRETEDSRQLAAAMAPYLGSGAFIRRQSLRVLQNNPADAAVLVEVRNIHYTSNAWALRSSELREQDVLMIADALRGWARRWTPDS